MTVPLVSRGNGRWGSPSPAWDHLINRESSGIPDIIQQIHDVNSGGNEAEGLFQITPKTWQRHNGTDFAASARRATPQQQAIVAARIFIRNPTGSDWGAGRPGRENPHQLAAGLVPLGQPSQEPAVPDNRPDFNEINNIDMEDGSHSSIRSQLPKNWFIHTQQGNGNAEDLFHFLMSTSGAGAVSYHYAIAEDPNDHGVTVVDIVDTDRYSWSVLNANVFSINACFAGSFAEQTRDQWLANYRNAIRVAAYLAVQDCKKYPTIAAVVIPPPYANHGSGISDHRFVTKALGIGSHTDVGGPMAPPWSGFPWDVLAADVNSFLVPAASGPDTPPPVVDTTPPTIPNYDTLIYDQVAGRWEMLGWRTQVESQAVVLDAVLKTKNAGRTGFTRGPHAIEDTKGTA